MKSENRRRGKKKKDKDSTFSQIRSMMFSLVLVGLSLLFVGSFRFFLKSQTYTGPIIGLDSSSGSSDDKFVADDDFDYQYIMIKNLSGKRSFCETARPGRQDEDSSVLKNGQVLEVDSKGTYQGKTYYLLKDGNYVEADESKVEEVSEYLPLKGYIVITYISSGGVRERTWLDYEDDSNIDKSVYVGETVDIQALVTTADGESAFQTTDGLYITSDSSYFTDYTNLAALTSEATTADVSAATGDTTATGDSSSAATENTSVTEDASSATTESISDTSQSTEETTTESE